jgi:phosphomevalonate kinase
MSELSRVPIEPPKQTKLLDACNEIPGIIMAGVPGGKYNSALKKFTNTLRIIYTFFKYNISSWRI